MAPTDASRRALVLSLAIIAASWGYTCWTAFDAPAPPATFTLLVVGVAWRKAALLGVVAGLLWMGGERLRDIGFPARPDPGAIGRGALAGVVIFAAINVALSSLLASLFPPAGVAGSLTDFFKDPSHLLAWVPIGVVGGGVVEEIERAFVITRVERVGPGWGPYAGLAASSVVFGIAHLYQSPTAAVSAGVAGLAFGLVYLRRRSGIEAAASHAMADVLGVLIATWLVR